MTISSHPQSTTSWGIEKRIYVILFLAVIGSVGVYLLLSSLTYRVGFPLDDAWIHQTYARNLALHLEWAFIPGIPSGGSTAPLWSALLAIGFWIKLAPYIWTYFLGAAALFGIAVLAEMTVRRLVPGYGGKTPWAGLLIILEWHLVWGAASGMETLLYALLVVSVLGLLMAGSKRYFLMGLIAALSVWVRPDGITLLGPLFVVILLGRADWKERLGNLFRMLLGFSVLFSFYLFFNLKISGSPWPNTFYAKQAEYAVYLAQPLWKRFGNEALQPLVGVGIVLLPGLILTLVKALKKRDWSILAAALWLIGFLGLYAWRLPVTYQHGRYVIPAMPVFFILSLAGLIDFRSTVIPGGRRLVGWTWSLLTAVLLLVFWARGAYSYAQDVAIIESEMVNTAQWVSQNVPPDSLVAAHDIGALGFFGGHNLVDLAGLISPEVVPFIRDESKIADYLSQRGVEYLVAFPDWYPQLTSGLSPIYSSGGKFAPALGEPNMAVYRWLSP